jgi:tRNA pseudouridine(55) synthase
MKKVIIINKQIGETPLEALEQIRIQEEIKSDIPMTYAGRLDPMAEGLLIILAGDACKDKEKYTKLDKEYEVEILFGISTDTYDTLGLIKKVEKKAFDSIDFEKYKCKFIQEYPAYSSKTVDGKQLHNLAREGNLPDEMPTKEVEIYLIEKIGSTALSGKRIADTIIENIKKVKGDFRQNGISEKWEKFGKDFELIKFIVIKIKVACSSGTYMRSLANRIGIDSEIPTLAYSIKRTRVGDIRLF